VSVLTDRDVIWMPRHTPTPLSRSSYLRGLSFVVLSRPVVLKGEDVGGVRSTSTLLYVEEEHHARMHHVVRQFWPVCIVPGVTPTSHAHTPSMLRVHTSKLLLILGVIVHVTSFNC
jgi:hypothetical protein